MSRTKGTIITGAPYEVNAAAPLDAKSNVGLKSDLFTAATWQAPSSSGANAGKMFCYYGMLVYVGNDTEANNGLYVLKNSGANDANVDALVETNWERISQPDSKIAAIKTNADKIDSKLDKDFVTQSSQGTLGEGTTFAARSDNTASATNVYITGKQIKDFAAAAVSDKGTFADDTALKAAYPTPEDGWSATVLSTGTTWISADGQWTDSGKSNGVTSVNGKSGKVTLVAADIDDVLSDTETDEHIQAAFTADREDLNTTAKSVVGGINEVKAAATKNAGDIASNASAISGKQNSTINLEIQGSTAATVSDALTSLDTALTSTKSTADNAAKKDASNIDAATWKTVLGYQNADEVATAVNNGITTNEYSTLATTAKTVKGAIEELKTAVDGKASSTDLTSIQGKVTALETTVGDAEDGLVKDVADNTAAINSANTEIAKKQNQAISVDGITAKTVEGALTEIKNATSTNATAISGKADKATTLAGYGIADAYTKTEVNTELGKKQDKLYGYNETVNTTELEGGEIGHWVSKIDISSPNTNIGGGQVTIDAPVITLTAQQIEVNGSSVLTGDSISKSIPASDTASDTKIPTEKAVATALESVKEVASKAYKYKGSDTYANIAIKENPAVGDVWNSTTANGVYPKGTNYAWNGTEWDALGGEVDLSAYQKASDNTLATTSKTVVGAINEVKGVADAAAKADASNITVATWKEKLGFITASEVPEQVQPDWNATSGKGQILNKPDINSYINDGVNVEVGRNAINGSETQVVSTTTLRIINSGSSSWQQGVGFTSILIEANSSLSLLELAKNNYGTTGFEITYYYSPSDDAVDGLIKISCVNDTLVKEIISGDPDAVTADGENIKFKYYGSVRVDHTTYLT